MKLKQPTTLWPSLFLISLSLLTLIGVLFVFEASLVESLTTFNNQYYIITQHLLGLGLGLGLFLLVSRLPTKLWLKFATPVYLFSLILLLATFIPGIGLKLNGAHRWINLRFVRFQPVEAIKFSLILFLTDQLAGLKNEKTRLIKFVVFFSLPALIILLQPDLGSLLLVGFIAVLVYFLVGGSIKSLMILSVAALPLVIAAIVFAPYRLQRLTTFLHPNQDILGSSFHIRQISLALGRGGLFGQGVGNSRQKYAYIPEAATDSIFAIVAEEVGFTGSLFILTLYLIFFVSGLKIIQDAHQPLKAKLIGQGFLIAIMAQVFFNLGAVVGLIPLTGMPLPFFSYGRSSQIMIWLAAAYIFSLTRTKAKYLKAK